jgi:hypothetical protein
MKKLGFGRFLDTLDAVAEAESPDRVIDESASLTDNEGMETNYSRESDRFSDFESDTDDERTSMTPGITFTLVGDEDESNIVVFVPGTSTVRVAHSSHPNFDKIVAGAIEGDESILDLFDLAEAAVKKFERLSERVTMANGRLYFDGEEIASPLTEQILRFMESDIEDYRPLVAFFENVQTNPSEHSREQLFAWLQRQNERGEGFTITPDGMIVGYKGVRKTDEGLLSIMSGKAIVNGEVHNGNVPNPLGATVEMPRSEVTFDPAVGCSRGLHVGTYAYANGFAQGALLEVHVNPRDVVSVPTECDAQKMRTCRYTVIKMIDAPYTVPVVYDDYEYDEYDGWGDGEYDEEDEW